MQPSPVKLSFKEQMHQAREEAILQATCRLLGEKAYDAMTMDDVANAVGIAKASLYKHFASKEALAAAAMVRVLQRTAEVVENQPSTLDAFGRLQAVTRWALQVQLAGEMPTLPSQNSSLRAELLGSKAYLDLLMQVSDRLGAWIQQAQADGAIDPALPPEVVLYTIFARACDPVLGFLLRRR